MGSWRGLGLGRRNKFNLDSVWVFAIERIVVWATGIRILIFIQAREPGGLCPLCNLIDVSPRLGVKCKVIEADPLAVVAGFNVLGGSLNKADVGFARHVAHTFRPALRLVIAESDEKGRPEFERVLQV